MRNTILATSLLSAIALASFALADGGITVSDVSYVQTGRNLVVNYRLTGDESAVVTIDILTNGVSIGAQNFTRLSGAVNTIVAPSATATNHIYWAARKEWPDHLVNGGVTVKVCARALTNPPDYFVLDLATGDKKWYASVDALPDGGLANDVYKTTKLVMRRIPAGGETFQMGYPSTDAGYTADSMPVHAISFTDDFYMGIYEVTEKQYATIWPGQARAENDYPPKRPRTNTNFVNIRGNAKWWPDDGHEVQTSPDRLIKRVRAIGGGIMFDIPTEAQWEYACRAGTTTLWSSGISWNGTQGVFVDGRGVCDQYMWADEWATELHDVGLLKPNDWGLYDMHGNAREICLDGWSTGNAALAGSVSPDPVGPAVDGPNAYRVTRGGSYNDSKAGCASAARNAMGGSTADVYSGCRLVCPAIAQ